MNYASYSKDRKSTSGMSITYNGAPIAWYTRNNSMVEMSTDEAGCIAVESAVETAHALREKIVDATG